MDTADALERIRNGELIPRVLKTREEKKRRSKSKAEVFTPSWVCNVMNNFCDEEWFGRKGVFNIENDDHTWTVTTQKVPFIGTDWQDYVLSTKIEITCGEAPYLVSRYDTTTGEEIDIPQRIGILDRKLRVVNERARNWLTWTLHAFESTYGYEYQGDNLLFARVNLLQTFIDYYKDRFRTAPSDDQIKQVLDVIVWNIWQMDGLKDTVPYDGSFCKIKDWRENEVVEFRSLKQ